MPKEAKARISIHYLLGMVVAAALFKAYVTDVRALDQWCNVIPQYAKGYVSLSQLAG